MNKAPLDHRLSIAPMMSYTDKHYRYLMRLISTEVVLYTEMITTQALLHGNRERLLAFDTIEQPLAIQLGGNSPAELASCAHMAEAAGYNEVNLNIGCPSSRVKQGQFGACLMAKPQLVADCVHAITNSVGIPVTIKTRIGIDALDSYAFLADFITTVSAAGCKTFIIHARKALLNGLSPKQNRQIPKLDYHKVYQIKKDFPALNIIINGGITKLKEVQQHLQHVDGVMVGRVAYHNPYQLATVDQLIFGKSHPPLSRLAILEQYNSYIEQQIKDGNHAKSISRHLIGLYYAHPHAKTYRRLIANSKTANDRAYLYQAIDFAMTHEPKMLN